MNVVILPMFDLLLRCNHLQMHQLVPPPISLPPLWYIAAGPFEALFISLRFCSEFAHVTT